MDATLISASPVFTAAMADLSFDEQTVARIVKFHVRGFTKDAASLRIIAANLASGNVNVEKMYREDERDYKPSRFADPRDMEVAGVRVLGVLNQAEASVRIAAMADKLEGTKA